MTEHRVSTREERLAARIESLKAEKELTRRSDELARRRRELLWVRIEKDYYFEGPGPRMQRSKDMERMSRCPSNISP